MIDLRRCSSKFVLCLSFQFLLACLSVTATGCGVQAPPEVATTESQFPGATLLNFDGSRQSIKDYHGKVAVINFWASWCAPCRREMPDLQRLGELLDPEQFVVLGVSVDEDRFLAEEFLLQHDINFTNYHDKERVVAQQELGINAYPETFLVNAQGKIVRQITGEQRWDSPTMISLLDEIKNNPAGTSSWTPQ